MKTAPARKWRAPAVIILLAAAVIASAYWLWWKPLALAGLRIALDRQMGASNLRADFERAELSGLNTLVIHNLSFGNLDEPTSLLIRQLRLTFSLRDLIRGRFKAPAALRHAVLDRPQLTLTFPSPAGTTGISEDKPAMPMPGLIPGIPVRIREGRLLMRQGPPPARMLTLSRIDGHIMGEENKTSLIASFRTPGSAGQNVTLRAAYTPGLLDISGSLKELDIAPLAAWIALFESPCRPESGRLTGKLGLSFSVTSEGRGISLRGIDGTVDVSAGSLAIAGLAFKLDEVNGRIRASGTEFTISGCSTRARGAEWRVDGEISGLSSPHLIFHAQTASLEMSDWYSKLHGTAACRLILESGREPATIRVFGEARQASYHGIPCESLSAAFTLSRSFSVMTIHELNAAIGKSGVSVAGRLEMKTGNGLFKWTISPTGIPVKIAGEILAKGGIMEAKAVSSDGVWDLRGKFDRRDGHLKGNIGAKAAERGTFELKADVQMEPPHGIEGDFSIKGIPYRSLYLPAPPKALADFEALLSASGKIGGEASSPSVSAEWTISVSKPGAYSGEMKGGLSATRTSKDIRCVLDRMSYRAKDAIIDGEGALYHGNGETSGDARLIISHLKIGRTSAESRAAVKCSANEGEREAEVIFDALRLDDQAYPDFTASAQESRDGSLSVKLMWDELLSAVINLQNGREKSVGVTAAFANLPIGPMAGLASFPAPTQRASGSLTVKGPAKRANVRSSLKWAHGDLSAKGWIALDGTGSFSISLSALERKLSAWLLLLREMPGLGGMPDIESVLETRELDLERNGDSVAAKGWLSARDLKIGDLLLGSGNLRIDKTPKRMEMEASLSGESGTYTLYPSELSSDGREKSLRAEFSIKKVPVGKGLLGCDRGGVRIKWDKAAGNGVFFLSGLGIDEIRSDEISVDLVRDGDAWRLSASEGSAVKTTGRISCQKSTVKIEQDQRTDGAWLRFEGPGDKNVRLSGTWKFPASPEDLTFSCRGLPSPAVLPILGVPAMSGKADTDLEWVAQNTPPLSGRIRLTQGRWGEFPFESFEITGAGTPGRAFDFSSIALRQGEELRATGTGGLKIHPERAIELTLTVDRLLLGYLKPFGFVEESSVIARGLLRVSGDPRDPLVNGTLRCDVGSFSPPLGFARLYLKEGQIVFQGHRAIIDAGLTDLAGAAVVVSGGSEFEGLVPTVFSLAMTAPSAVRIDGLPDYFDGSARGKLNFEGTLREPTLRGKVTLEDGRLKTPPRRKQGDPESLAERLRWDLKIRFGRNVKYSLDPLGGTALNLATLSPSPLSLIEVVGAGEDIKVYGEVHADSGPLTLFLGKRIWKKRPAD